MFHFQQKASHRAGVATALNTSRRDLSSVKLVELATCLEADIIALSPFDRDCAGDPRFNRTADRRRQKAKVGRRKDDP